MIGEVRCFSRWSPGAGRTRRPHWSSPGSLPRALDAVLNEAMYVSGPLVVSVLVLFADPIVVTGLVGLAMLVGTLLLVGTPSVRRRAASSSAEQVRLLLAIIVCDAFAFGSAAAGQLISLVGDDVDIAFLAAGEVTAFAALLSLLVRRSSQVCPRSA